MDLIYFLFASIALIVTVSAIEVVCGIALRLCRLFDFKKFVNTHFNRFAYLIDLLKGHARFTA